MGERNYALALGKTKGMRIGTSVVFVVASLAVVAVRTHGAFPDSVVGVKLFTKAATVWKWEGLSRTAGRHFFVVILGHGEPPETVVTGVFYCRSESHPPSAYGFWSVVVGDEGAVIEVWMDAGDDSGFDEAVSSFSVPNPPARPLVGQLAFAPSEYLVF